MPKEHTEVNVKSPLEVRKKQPSPSFKKTKQTSVRTLKQVKIPKRPIVKYIKKYIEKEIGHKVKFDRNVVKSIMLTSEEVLGNIIAFASTTCLNTNRITLNVKHLKQAAEQLYGNEIEMPHTIN